MKFAILTAAAICLMAPGARAHSRTNPVPFPAVSSQASQSIPVIGEVIAIDTAHRKITLQTKKGEVLISLNGDTAYVRVPPGENNLKNGEATTLTEIKMGDRVMAFTATSEIEGALLDTSPLCPARGSTIAGRPLRAHASGDFATSQRSGEVCFECWKRLTKPCS